MLNKMDFQFLSFIAVVIGIIAGFLTIMKINNDFNKNFSNLDNKISNLDNKIEKLNSKFDILNERLNSTNTKVDYTIPRVERLENQFFTYHNGATKKAEQSPELEYH